MIRFEERIYELRKLNNLTQEDIARELNVSRQTISNWETGSAQPTIDKVVELARIYNISINELVDENVDTQQKESAVLKQLVNKKVTLYLEAELENIIVYNTNVIKKCRIVEVYPASMRVNIESKKQSIETLIFLKDIVSIEMEEDNI